MCAMRYPMMAVLVGALGLSSAYAQVFESGSDGSFGEILVESQETVTIDLPPDGIINATTVTLRPGGILRFNRNLLNTPVFLLATGDIILERGVNRETLIDVSGSKGLSVPPWIGKGGPGGFDGGMANLGGLGAGAGQGPGGALGNAGHATAASGFSPGAAYGSPLLMPLVGGSGEGGATNRGGDGGGGAILLASNTLVEVAINSEINADGVCGGSGGAIRIVAPVVAGRGRVFASGGCGGSMGRIRIDTIDRSQMLLSTGPVPSQGRFMKVFQDVVPRLDIVDVAGVVIPEGEMNPVTVQLPFDGDPFQTVTIRATDFTGVVPIEVVLTPDVGNRIVVPAVIDMGLGNPTEVVVDIVVPLNNITRIHAWTQSVP